MKKIGNILKNSDFFYSIDNDRIEKFFESGQILIKEYKKNSIILSQNAICKNLIYLFNGCCFGEIIDFSGKVIRVEQMKAPYIIAPAVLFASENKMPVSLIAKTDSSILYIKKEAVLKEALQNRIFLENILNHISNKFLFISQKLTFMSFKGIKSKFANYLLSQKNNENYIELKISIDALSQYFATSRPSLSRVLNQMIKEKIILKNKNIIKIIDNKKLMQCI